MQWVCLQDKHPLTREADRYVCAFCGRIYRIRQGIPILCEPHQVDVRQPTTPVMLGELEMLMAHYPGNGAFDAFCRKYACSENRSGADWKFFFSVPKEGQVLEFGPGFGEDTVDIASRTGTVISIVPTRSHAAVLNKRLERDGVENVQAAVMREIVHLPLPDHSISAIVMSDALGSGFNLNRRTFPAIASEWRRVMMPGGIVLLGLANPIHRWLGYRVLISKMIPDCRESIDHLIKRFGCQPALNTLGWRKAVRIMVRSGFTSTAIYTPIPDERKPDILIPIDDTCVVRYFLNHLVRKNSLVIQMGIAVSNILLSLNLFHHLMPYYFIYFQMDPAAGRGSFAS